MKKFTYLFLVLIITFLSSGKTQDFNPLLAERYQHVLDSMITHFNLKGASSAILMKEKGLWTGSTGYSHDTIEITADMLFRDASNTSLFVSAAIMQLVDEGTVSLEDPISKWIKPYENIDGNITIRQLLNHTSGVDDYIIHLDIRANPSQHLSPYSLLTYVEEPYFAPGTDWEFSNTNNILLGLIINKVTGIDTIAHTFANRFFDPLGLQNTFFEGEEPVSGTWAHGWDNWDGDGTLQDVFNYPQQALISGAWTAGALVANAEDMVKWMKALCNGQLLSAEGLKEMLTFADLTPANSDYYVSFALGLGGINYNNTVVWGLGGYHFGYTTQTVYDPEYKVALSLAINQSNSPVDAILKKLHQESLHYYNYPFDKVHPQTIELNHTYIPQTEQLVINSKLNNPENNYAIAFAHYFNADSSIVDSLQIFDDGKHQDSLAKDGLFGLTIKAPNIEDNFYVKVSSYDVDSGYRHITSASKAFTTKGPVTVDHIEITSADTVANPGDIIAFELFLKNNGSTAPVSAISTELIPLDSCLTSTNLGNRTIESLAAGQVSEHNRTFRLQIDDECAPVTMAVQVNMYENENLFWIDTLFIDIVSSLADPEPLTAHRFHLQPNYPNPFNPFTNFKYTVGVYRNTPVPVQLSIYNLLGEKIATLVNQKQQAGVYTVQWDASDFPSGVYIYKLTAGAFMQSHKMILLK